MPARKRATAKRRGSTRVEPLSLDCRCQCSVVCMITGDAEIKKKVSGKVSKKYEVLLTVSGNAGCKDGYNHTRTTWAQLEFGNPQMAGKARKKNETKTSVEIEVDDTCPAADIGLKATADATRRCKGTTNALITCSSQTNFATIKVVDP